jgi:3'-phosphoadenosine 5'-phosphosulfate sulfotransferase (PAPS reductase)/FAD synthetase
MRTDVAMSPEIDIMLLQDAAVALGVSGGKDSCALVFAALAHLDSIGHQGPRVLVHADLGRIEWKDSLPTCQRLADVTGLELMVVRREKGDMVDRWKQRWTDNVARYASLSCVQIILPWSTPAMRFCTGEMKLDPICRALAKRFPGAGIVSASGIRAEESSQRAKSPVSKPQPKLTYKTLNTWGMDWSPLLRWSLQDVLDICEAYGFDLSEVYRVYNSSRLSCCFCILATAADLMAAAGCDDNHDVYRELVELEIDSTFAFQGNRWLGDCAPELLSNGAKLCLAGAKQAAAKRQEIEARIPKHLLYEKGWPTCLPTWQEAELLAAVRSEVATLLGLDIQYTDAASVRGRYEELMEAKNAKAA